jgi:hypothetical protein
LEEFRRRTTWWLHVTIERHVVEEET